MLFTASRTITDNKKDVNMDFEKMSQSKMKNIDHKLNQFFDSKLDIPLYFSERRYSIKISEQW